MSVATPMTIRKVADTSRGERLRRFDPITGEKILVNPETGSREPWPLAGVLIEGDVTKPWRISTRLVASAIREGWLKGTERRVEQAAGGPENDPHRVRHQFTRYETLTFRCLDGNYLFEVIHQPGKYRDGEQVRVDWFYELRFLGRESNGIEVSKIDLSRT